MTGAPDGCVTPLSDTGTKAFDGRRRSVALICGMRRTQTPAVTPHGTCRAGLARPPVTPFTAGSRRADVSRNWHTSRMDYGCRDRTRRCVFVGRHSLPSCRALCMLSRPRTSLAALSPAHSHDVLAEWNTAIRPAVHICDQPTRACCLFRAHGQTTYGDRSFAVSGPVAWNSLPVALRSSDVTEETFRRHLKTFLLYCLDN